jgi:hypothetical protein
MRRLEAILLVVMLGGCTSVKVAQRDGCWVKRTEKWLGGSKEELGPCAPPQPRWADDRLTRMVQECEARADYRWQTHALEAFSRGEQLPPPAADKAVLQECMGEASRAMATENDVLKQKLAEAASTREAEKAKLEEDRQRADEERKRVEAERAQGQAKLDEERRRADANLDEERTHLHASNEKLAGYLGGANEKLAESLGGANGKLAEWLGQAANKAQAPATATASATSEGHLTSDGQLTTDASSTTPPTAPAAMVVSTPGAAPQALEQPLPTRRARSDRKGKASSTRVKCEPAAPAGEDPATATASALGATPAAGPEAARTAAEVVPPAKGEPARP